MGAWISRYYISKDDLTKREFIKGGDMMFLFSMQGKVLLRNLRKQDKLKESNLLRAN